MNDTKIPDWATPGGNVVIEPGSFRRDRVFHKATITRVTKASVFAKADGSSYERRFVVSRWGSDNDRLVEYGNSGNSWSHDTYLWNADCDQIKQAKEQAKLRGIEKDLAQAASDLAEVLNRASRPGLDYSGRIATLRAAITSYEVSHSADNKQ